MITHKLNRLRITLTTSHIQFYMYASLTDIEYD